MLLKSMTFIKQEKLFYKKYRSLNYSINFSRFKAFHDAIKYFKDRNIKMVVF